MAVPRLATPEPFYLLDPTRLAPPFEVVATGSGAAQTAPTVGTDQMRPIDLVICGSVAVNRHGARLGKGAGYSDLEVALLVDAGLIWDATLIATTVHDLQVIDSEISERDHDLSVDLVATPTEIIHCGRRHRPRGIDPSRLTAKQRRAIPVLRDHPASAAEST